ncbi:MAG TPA: glycosyltransferase family 4 protein [Bacteroidota bacterium]|nr:glycosyltransferase family 4 protein [Bacteroidota bacterium]
MKILALLTTGLKPVNRELERQDAMPRASLFEDELHTEMLYENTLMQAPAFFRFFYRRLPMTVAQTLEAYRIRKRYDAVLSWSDPHGLLFSFLLKATFSRTPHIAMLAWISKPRKAKILKRVYTGMSRIILWTSNHYEFATKQLGIPASRIKLIHYFVDQQFWRPMPDVAAEEMICSAGVEMRDYPTFIEALRGIDIRCHIAAGIARGKLFDTVTAISRITELPPNLTVGPMSPVELRNLYARSRFVVVPLHPSESDNGITVILEAMAMGKAVICSRINGQKDVIIDGVNGIFVPPGNPRALRDAMLYLLKNPDAAAAMGRAGRAHIEKYFRWDDFVKNIRETIEEVVKE